MARVIYMSTNLCLDEAHALCAELVEDGRHVNRDLRLEVRNAELDHHKHTRAPNARAMSERVSGESEWYERVVSDEADLQ